MRTYFALGLVIFALSAGSTRGESNQLIEEMTWEEVKAAIDSGADTVIITIGATEQHGLQIALASDSITGDYLASEIAKRIGRTLIAPSIRVGVSPHHMYFPVRSPFAAKSSPGSSLNTFTAWSGTDFGT